MNRAGRETSGRETTVHKRVEVADGYALPCDRGQRLASFEWTDQWVEVTCFDCLATAGREPTPFADAVEAELTGRAVALALWDGKPCCDDHLRQRWSVGTGWPS